MNTAQQVSVLAIICVAGCSRPVRQYTRAEVIGEYVFALDNEGLVLGADGTFEHCWKADSGPSSESGNWELFNSRGTQSAVTLFHARKNRSKAISQTPDGPWQEGLLVEEIDGRVGLILPFYKKGRYYVKQGDGQHVCPRP